MKTKKTRHTYQSISYSSVDHLKASRTSVVKAFRSLFCFPSLFLSLWRTLLRLIVALNRRLNGSAAVEARILILRLFLGWFQNLRIKKVL